MLEAEEKKYKPRTLKTFQTGISWHKNTKKTNIYENQIKIQINSLVKTQKFC